MPWCFCWVCQRATCKKSWVTEHILCLFLSQIFVEFQTQCDLIERLLSSHQIWLSWATQVLIAGKPRGSLWPFQALEWSIQTAKPIRQLLSFLIIQTRQPAKLSGLVAPNQLVQLKPVLQERSAVARELYQVSPSKVRLESTEDVLG